MKNLISRLSVASLLLALSALTVLAGCAVPDRIPDESATAEELYRSGKLALGQNDFLTAIEVFETLGARYPFGNFTQQAQLDIMYAYYRQDEYDNAISAADRFIKLYPQSEDVDYAYYMKGLSNFSRGSSFTERLFPRDMARVNQNWLRSSFADFDGMIRRFPDSRYVDDARERMAYLRNQMARHEMITARFYYERGAMVAVVNRVTYLLEHFRNSDEVPNALALLADAYDSLGQPDLEQDTLRVLQATAPDHPALERLEARASQASS